MADYISHHGILGQKWGQKNGPPYPLGSDVSTGRRLKEAFTKHKAAKEEKYTKYMKKGFYNLYKEVSKEHNISEKVKFDSLDRKSKSQILLKKAKYYTKHGKEIIKEDPKFELVYKEAKKYLRKNAFINAVMSYNLMYQQINQQISDQFNIQNQIFQNQVTQQNIQNLLQTAMQTNLNTAMINMYSYPMF